jgi:hypothetical protein
VGVTAPPTAPTGVRFAATLRDACEVLAYNAKDFHTIELRTNAPLREKPFAVAAAQLTIRAGVGYQPHVIFKPEGATSSLENPMIEVSGGVLHLEGLRLTLALPENAANSWSLFRLGRPQAIELRDCALTIRRPQATSYLPFRDQVAFFDLNPPMVSETMQKDQMAATLPVQIQLDRCLARGEASLLRAQRAMPISLRMNDSLLATSERLLEMGGAPSEPMMGDAARVELSRVTVLARGGLCRMKTSEADQHQLTLDLQCSNGIILTDEQSPLIELDRSKGRPKALDDLRFTGGGYNYFPHTATMLRVRGGAGEAAERIVARSQWASLYGATLPEMQELLWDGGQSPLALAAPPEEHLPTNYELSRSVSNPPYDMGADMFHAGCDVLALPAEPPPP